MQQITRTVLRHKRLVGSLWIILTLIGMAAAGPASESLDQRFSVPGREGWEASQEILRSFGNGGKTLPLVPVVQLPQGASTSSPAVRADLRRLEQATKKAVPGARVAGLARPENARSHRATAKRRSSTPSRRGATIRSAAASTPSATSRQRCATRPLPARPCV